MKLTINEKIGFGAGDMAIAIVMMSLAMIITYFYTDVFGLKPVDLGILLFSVRILDAVIDPVVGTMTDITNTRWGKYRPWLLFMSIPFGISIWLMFTTPDTDYSVKLLWAWATYVLLTLTYTLIAIPYVSLISVITDDPQERLSANGYRFVMTKIAMFAVTIIVPLSAMYLGKNNVQLGYQIAMGTMGIAMILAPAIGPTLSGYIVQNYDWNVMFYGMFFIGIIAIVIGLFWFKLYQSTTNPKADIPGIIYSTIGFGSLLYGFSEAGNKGWGSTEIVTMFIVGTVFIIFFILRELRMKAPMLSLEVLKYPTYTLTTIINMIVMMSLYGGMILLPLYLQNLRGFSALDSGLLLLPGALVMGALGPVAGKLLDTIGIKPLAIFGIGIMTYATWELSKLNMDTTYLHIMWIYIVRSFGMAFVMMPIITAGMNALPPRLISHGNAFVNTMRQLAGSIGTAILVTVMTTQQTNHLSAFGEELDKTNPVIQDHMRELAQQYGGESAAMKLLLEHVNKLASVEGVNDAFIVATIISAIALILSLFLQGKKKAQLSAEKANAEDYPSQQDK